MKIACISDIHGNKLALDEVLSDINKIRENTKKGIIDSHCTGCFALTEQEWEDNKKFKISGYKRGRR